MIFGEFCNDCCILIEVSEDLGIGTNNQIRIDKDLSIESRELS